MSKIKRCMEDDCFGRLRLMSLEETHRRVGDEYDQPFYVCQKCNSFVASDVVAEAEMEAEAERRRMEERERRAGFYRNTR